MPRLQSDAILESEEARNNRTAHIALIAQVRALEGKVRDASARAAAKFAERKQLLPRDRMNLLFDRDQPFLELSTLCGLGMHEDDGVDAVFGGGCIAGIGMIAGVRCMMLANDAGIKGGALQPMGVEKIIRAQTIALENRLPYVQLVESAGANLMYQAELFVRGGMMFANMAKLSAAGLPVVSVVHGSSTAGGAYQTGLADYVILVRGRSKIFLAGPPLLKAATGEIAGDEALGGAEMHATVTGVGEYLAEDDADAIRICREVIGGWGWNDGKAADAKPFAAPLYDAEGLLSVAAANYRTPYNVREVIARIVDGSEFLDFKPDYGPHTVCGHAAIEGYRVGILGNNGPIDSAGATKAGQFIQLCCQSMTPLVFLQNTTGFMVGVEAERSGIVKHGSKMIQAVTNATVPKITIQIGASFGAGHYKMCGRSFGPRFVFSWPNNRLSVMGGDQAAKVLAIVSEDGARRRGVEPDRERIAATTKMVTEAYDHDSTALFATARLWDDGLIDPRDTRRVLGFCLATVQEGDTRIVNPNSFGVARL